MNQLNKARYIISKSRLFAQSLKSDKHNIKNVILENRKVIGVGSSSIGIGLLCYYLYDEKLSTIFRASYCNSNFIYRKSNLVYEWTNKPEFVKNQEIRGNVETSDEKIDTIGNLSQSDVKSDIKTETPVFVTPGNDNEIATLPLEVPYLIIGAGIAGMSAARAIRASDPLAKVLIINSEYQSPGQHKALYPPYRRVLLSKFIWRRSEEHQKTLLDTNGDVKSSSFLFVEPESFFVPPETLNSLEYGGISLLNGVRVISIDSGEHCVVLDGDGHKIRYEQCLIATGSYPRRLTHLETSLNTGVDLYEQGRVSYFRSLNDFRNLFDKVTKMRSKDGSDGSNNSGRVLIVGSGLLGTELSSSLGRLSADHGGSLEIVQVYKEPSHLWHLLPAPLSHYIQSCVARHKVKLLPRSEVVSISEVTEGDHKGRISVNIRHVDGAEQPEEHRTEEVDHVVIAAGVKPDTALALPANLEIDPHNGGYLVNAELLARADIYVAGDACSFHDPLLGRRRVEHWDHAEESGAVAGHNMAASRLLRSGAVVTDSARLASDVRRPRLYRHQTAFSFKSGLYRSVVGLGLIDSSLDTRVFVAKEFFDDSDVTDDGDSTVAKEPSPSPQNPLDMPGVVFYLRNRRVVGVLLWNCDDDIVVDSDYPSPLRSNVARKVLEDRLVLAHGDGVEEQLRALAADFDLSFFVNGQIKALDAFVSKRRLEDAAVATATDAAAAEQK